MKKSKTEVVPSSRSIIENVLLSCLSNKDKVALVLDKEDLDALIVSLENETKRITRSHRHASILIDLKKLRNAVFGDPE